LGREVIGAYAQLPFKLAWAITIHTSQGLTMERLVVDLTAGCSRRASPTWRWAAARR
jgi:ATP-dependent exoDNAse (exonuclease V) alpha subunit